MHCRPIHRLLIVVAVGSGAMESFAQERAAERAAGMGGPTSVEGQIREDRIRRLEQLETAIDRFLNPYYEFKARVAKSYGFSYGADYNVLYQHASSSPGEQNAAAGAVRFFAIWDLVGRETANRGSLVFRIQHRHRIGTDITPLQLGPAVGYAGLTATVFSDRGWLLTNLLWNQVLLDGRLAFKAGIIDATDFVDNYHLISSWTSFNNFVFRRPTTPVPDQGIGFAFRFYFSETIYATGGWSDNSADASDVEGTFEKFFEDRRNFVYAEFGWTGSRENPYADNVHVTLWYDSPDEATDARGASLSWNRTIDDRLLPFVRIGFSDGGNTRWEASATIGCGYQWSREGNMLAIGLNWGKPSGEFFGENLQDQYTAEIFYRFSLTPSITVTPDLQVLIDPALNPDKDAILVVGIRARVNF
ncbi:MAG: carbohydrate porin [Planctomycetota bacterium]|jgi:porin